MIIDITRLKSLVDKYVAIDETISFTSEQLKNTDIIELNNARVTGKITKGYEDTYDIDVVVSGVMVLPCSISLKPVNHEFEFNITGNLNEMMEEINEIVKKTENSIDILPIIWENILMEIPMKVVSDNLSDVKVKGDGWRLVTEEDNSEINPELQKLKELLK